MNPSYEAMERARREKLASLLQIGREQAVKRLGELHLCGDSHAMLSQIAYAINPYVGAWDAESCDHLRRVLAEIIGDASEAASDAQSRCACGAGGCDRGHEQTALDSERRKAVCELGKLMGNIDDLNSYYQFVGELFDALGVDDCPEDELCWDDRLISLCDRLIHLLGGEQPRITFDQGELVVTNGENETRITNDDVIVNGVSFADAFDEMTDGAYSRVFRRQSRTCPESEPDVSEGDDGTSVTSELRKYVSIHETMNTVYTTMPPRMEEEPTHKGKKLLAIADRIDAQFARVCEQHEVVLQDANNIQLLAECLKPVIADNDKRVAKLEAERDDLLDLLRDARDEYKMLDRMSAETSVNFHTMRDRVWGLEAERDELQGKIADLNEQLERRKAKCLRYKTHIDQMQGGSKRLRKELCEQEGTYLDLLRDAARDYKALLDRLNELRTKLSIINKVSWIIE